MKFCIIENASGEVVGCQTSFKAAMAQGRAFGAFSVDRVDAPVTSETIRRLLGNVGGYAHSTNRVYPLCPREVTP